MKTFLQRYTTHFVVIVAVLGMYWTTRLPVLGKMELRGLTGQFQFTPSALPELDHLERKSVRDVHPDLAHVSAWISAMGAAVALHDLDGDGLDNDLCYVDPRVDRVIVGPVPEQADRFAPFTLDPPASLHYDPKTMAPTGCVPGDYNEDGRIDVLVYYWGRPPVVFLNRGGDGLGPDRFAARDVAPGDQRWNTAALTTADVDGDGHVDLIVGNYFPDGARPLDADGENRETMQDSMSHACNGGRNRVLLWAGATSGDAPTLRYVDAGDVFDADVAQGWTLAIGAADLDGDLLPELYFSNDFGPDRLLHNRSEPGAVKFALLAGRKTITVPNSKVLGRDSFKGMGVDFGDMNGDGLLDIYVSNIAAEWALHESHFMWVSTGRPELMAEGVAPYVDQSEPMGLSRSGWGWESRLADFDNDGVLEAVQATGFVRGHTDRWPELHELALANDALVKAPASWFELRPGDDLSGHDPNCFFVKSANGRYHDIADELGLGGPMLTRGIATADVDGDGDLDMAMANQWASSVFYRNDAVQAGAFLGLRLLLPVAGTSAETTVVQAGLDPHAAGRPAIGATAAVCLPDGRTLVGQVDGGNGFAGVRSPRLHFGLGAVGATRMLEIELRWRDDRGGTHRQALQLRPGWHTVLLASAPSDTTADQGIEE
ncbi:MAG: RNA-binding protein [Phycisphaeraceae bacterium]|nr:RNA-binding protein [Phycisphaeraceae bacterium]